MVGHITFAWGFVDVVVMMHLTSFGEGCPARMSHGFGEASGIWDGI